MHSSTLPQDKVLVCVSHPAHAPLLISHGARMMRSSGAAEGLVLHIQHNVHDERRWSDHYTTELVSGCCAAHGLTFREMPCETRTAGSRIRQVIGELRISMVVLGQRSPERVSATPFEPVHHQLIGLEPAVSIHLVDTSPEDEDDLGTGAPVWLSRFPEGWCLTSGDKGQMSVPGVYFANPSGEPGSGFFVCTSGEKSEVVKIADGVPVSPSANLTNFCDRFVR